MEEKGSNGGALLIVLMVIMALLLCCSFVGIYLMMVQTNELRDEVNELKDNKEDSNEEKIESSTKCKSIVGAYYAEVVDGNLHMKQTYSFSADGTFITYVENGGASNGTYTLNDGVITFKQSPEVGPSSESFAFSRNVSDDCKIIYVNEDNLKYELKRMEQ